MPRKKTFNSATVTLPVDFGMRVHSKNEGSRDRGCDALGSTHIILGHYTRLLCCVCKDVRITDVEIIFVVRAEDWRDQCRLSRRTSNLKRFGHESMCRDGQTDRASKGTNKGMCECTVLKYMDPKVGKKTVPPVDRTLRACGTVEAGRGGGGLR